MRLNVDRQAFAAALGQAAKYVKPRTTIPVLSTVLLRTGDGEIEVAATDLDRLFRATIEARVEAEGAIAANASLLAGFVRGAVGTDVELALTGSLLEVRSGHARGRIPTFAADDFPEPFNTGRPTLASRSTALYWQLAATPSVTRYRRRKGRYYLTGANWSIHNGRLELAATTVKSYRQSASKRRRAPKGFSQ